MENKPATATTNIPATAVAVNGMGVLLRGPSGSGKSDLALRLIDRGAQLIADDYVTAGETSGAVMLTPPATIAGMLELRGAGVAKFAYETNVPLALVVDLVRSEDVERMPEPEETTICGAPVPLMKLNGFDASAPIKVEMTLAAITGDLEMVQ
ncbi:MAG: aldolase [Rhodospirillaceae bacterium]|jgi:serine kinase of HPr protein (carbohydrate metabolism regulator)|nr:aldolase [Rhodospirillaceae bacterium]MBT4118292.1 aldolase [Rhodospirillaceae bacterium]MBT4671992.1 aldolase [Rhodospirillaceae bacterium]MBT4719780.1 aldolase [Rhodospirillaceae bacterium]MBT4751025.1 aldolase [Rhodospirillaceae bacterium]